MTGDGVFRELRRLIFSLRRLAAVFILVLWLSTLFAQEVSFGGLRGSLLSNERQEYALLLFKFFDMPYAGSDD